MSFGRKEDREFLFLILLNNIDLHKNIYSRYKYKERNKIDELIENIKDYKSECEKSTQQQDDVLKTQLRESILIIMCELKRYALDDLDVKEIMEGDVKQIIKICDQISAERRLEIPAFVREHHKYKPKRVLPTDKELLDELNYPLKKQKI